MPEKFFRENTIEAGCDEAGRGCLAGPVFAAAVILPPTYEHPLLNDSKKLSVKTRNLLRKEIEENAIAWAVAEISNTEIDNINILKASIKAMHKALEQLKVIPEIILVDGKFFNPYKNIPHYCFIKGDQRYQSVAAASILAKTHRDEFMLNLHGKYQHYCWDKNKGYPTPDHRRAILKHGITEYHRKSFRLLDDQLEIPFTD